MFAVEFDSVWKIYKKDFKQVTALKNIILKIPQNSIFSIIGPNGAGKTTALKIITGITYPTKGKVKVLGGDISDSNIKKRVGFLPENPSFFSNITPFEFLKFVLYTSEGSIEEDKIISALNEVGLLKEKNEKVKKFSKGMVQRLGIAQAIIHNPDLIVLDEPFSGLDPIAKEKLKEIILNFFKKGKTIILSSHNLFDVESLSTHITLIKEGEIKIGGMLKSLQSHANYEIEFYGEIKSWGKRKVKKVGEKSIIILENEKEFEEFLINASDLKLKIVSVNLSLNNYLKRYYQ